MRGLYNGEIRDRTHLFSLFHFVALLVIIPGMFLYGSVRVLIHQGETEAAKGIILLCIGFFLAWFILLAIGREFVFITINPTIIKVRRPLLKISPFKKDKTLIEIPVEEIVEINTYRFSGRYQGAQWWRIISKDGKEILKFSFDPEFIGHTVELEDYFKENNMNIRVNRKQPVRK